MPLPFKFIKVTSKLSGYLFVLCNITHINDKISLYSHSNKKELKFTKMMLDSIGLHVRIKNNLRELCQPPEISLILINSCNELKTLELPYDSPQCFVTYIADVDCHSNLVSDVERFMMQYPNCIVIANAAMDIVKKNFYIAINPKNPYFTVLEKGILSFGTD